MVAQRLIVASSLLLGSACKKSADKAEQAPTPDTSLCRAAASPDRVLDFPRRVYGDANAITLARKPDLAPVIAAAKREGVTAFEQWTGHSILVANHKILQITLVASNADAWRERVGPLIGDGRLPGKDTEALEVVLAQADARALGLALGDAITLHPLDDLESVRDPIEAKLVGLVASADAPLIDTSPATGFSSRSLVAGALSVGFAVPEGAAPDWVAQLGRIPELAEYDVLSAESLQQPLVEWLSAVHGLCGQAKAPAGKHVSPPVVAGSCADIGTWDDDAKQLRALLGDQVSPADDADPNPTAREPIALHGSFMFDTEGLQSLPMVGRSAKGMRRLAPFVTQGSLDDLEGRDVPAIALTPSTAAAMGLSVGDTVQLATEQPVEDPSQRYTVETVQLVALITLPNRVGHMIGAWGWRLLPANAQTTLEARWYEQPVGSRYMTADRLPMFGDDLDQQAQTFRKLCAKP